MWEQGGVGASVSDGGGGGERSTVYTTAALCFCSRSRRGKRRSPRPCVPRAQPRAPQQRLLQQQHARPERQRGPAALPFPAEEAAAAAPQRTRHGRQKHWRRPLSLSLSRARTHAPRREVVSIERRPDVEQVVRHAAALLAGRLCGADVEPLVHLHRVGRDDLAIQPQRQLHAQRRLPRRGGASHDHHAAAEGPLLGARGGGRARGQRGGGARASTPHRRPARDHACEAARARRAARQGTEAGAGAGGKGERDAREQARSAHRPADALYCRESDTRVRAPPESQIESHVSHTRPEAAARGPGPPPSCAVAAFATAP